MNPMEKAFADLLCNDSHDSLLVQQAQTFSDDSIISFRRRCQTLSAKLRRNGKLGCSESNGTSSIRRTKLIRLLECRGMILQDATCRSPCHHQTFVVRIDGLVRAAV